MLLVLAMALSAPALAGDQVLGPGSADPTVLPPHSNPWGMSYDEWIGAWGHWVFNIPFAVNPLFEATGAFCEVEQSGPVWYLTTPGCLGPPPCTSDLNLSCTIPAGKAVFVDPIFTIGGTFGNAEGLLAEFEAIMSTATGLSAELDGVPLEDLDNYRAASLFPIGPLPEGNIFGLPAGVTANGAAAGIVLILAPLSVGQHTLHTTATIPGLVTTNVTWNLTVVPSGGHLAAPAGGVARSRNQLISGVQVTAPLASTSSQQPRNSWGRLKLMYR